MKKLKRAQHLSWKNLGDHLIILDSQGLQQVHHLDGVAAFIWEQLDGENSNNDIIRNICGEYNVLDDLAKSDFEKFISDLNSNELLEKQ